jgi:Phospholipase_D-nuclease N-terminal
MRFFSSSRRLLSLPFLGFFLFFISSCSRRGHFLFGRSAWGLFIFVLDVLAVLDIFKQPWDLSRKLVWTVVILLLPMVGLIAYYFFSGRKTT